MLAKLEKVLSKVLGGSSTEKELKRIHPIVDNINQIVEEYKNLTDDELKAKTNEFRYRLKMGETLDDLLPEAFAAVKDTCRRLVGKRFFKKLLGRRKRNALQVLHNGRRLELPGDLDSPLADGDEVALLTPTVGG